MGIVCDGIMNKHTPIKVGGQAVVEGVMMRSPRSFAVAVRRANGEIVITESPWRSFWERYKFLRWPFLRGSVVLLESMINGITALNFSARVAMSDEEQEKKNRKNEVSSKAGTRKDDSVNSSQPIQLGTSEWILWSTLFLGLLLGIGLFIALPHLAVWLGSQAIGRELTVEEFLFHLVVGVVKLGVFLGYIVLISLMKDVRRLFMYHGAEHQSILVHGLARFYRR